MRWEIERENPVEYARVCHKGPNSVLVRLFRNRNSRKSFHAVLNRAAAPHGTQSVYRAGSLWLWRPRRSTLNGMACKLEVQLRSIGLSVILAVVIGCLGGAPFAWAVRPLGSDVQVNASTFGEQHEPAVVSGGGGTFLTVWSGSMPTSRGQRGVFARLFDPEFFTFEPELLVSDSQSNQQTRPAVVSVGTSGFVVAWERAVGLSEVVARMLDNRGQPIGDVFAVTNADRSRVDFNLSIAPRLVSDLRDRFVIAWFGADSSLINQRLYARVFDLAGAPLRSAFVVIESSSAEHQHGVEGAQLAMRGDGALLVVWTSDAVKQGKRRLVARVVDIETEELGPVFELNHRSILSPVAERPKAATALANGSFVVVSNWHEKPDQSTNVWDWYVNAYILPSGGYEHIESIIVAIESTPKYIGDADVAALPDGGFIVTWSQRPDSNTERREIMGRIFDEFGNARTGAFRVNDRTPFDQSDPSVAIDMDSDRMLVVWRDNDWPAGHDGHASGIFGRLLSVVPRCGDIDGDSNVSAADALAILLSAAVRGRDSAHCETCVCDSNGDGQITGADALLAMHLAVGLAVETKCAVCPNAG